MHHTEHVALGPDDPHVDRARRREPGGARRQRRGRHRRDGQAWIYSGQDHQDGGPDSATYVLGDDGHWCRPVRRRAPSVRSTARSAASPTDSLLFGGDYVGDPPTPPFYDGLYSNTVFRWTGSDWSD
ncbi:MAG: hypothetical protein R2690_00145 [Acidimicrobiales bacterium]